MRRYISLACVALIVVMCIVSPVNAVDNELAMMDVLQYTSVNSEGNFFSFTGSTVIDLELPYNTFLYSVDLLFNAYGVTSIEVLWGGQEFPLSITSIGNGLFRAIGYITGNYTSLSLRFNNNGSAPTYVTLISCRVDTLDVSSFDSEAYCTIATVDYDSTIHYVPTDTINYRSFKGTDEALVSAYRLDLYNLDWRKYDFIDYLIYLSVGSVDSITCELDGVIVPHTVSILDNSTEFSNDYLICIRVDCRNLDRSVNGVAPYVSITGNVILGEVNLVSVMSCVGLIDSNINWVNIFLRKILSSLNEKLDSIIYWIKYYSDQILVAIRGDTAPGNEFQQEVEQKDQQLKDMAAVMDSVDRPDTNSVIVSADTYVDQTVLATSMQGLTAVISMPVFLDVIMMSLILATAGYVLFGKR